MQLGKSTVIRPTRYLACWLGALLLPGTLIAQEGAQTSTAELEEIIVEATRLSRPLDRVPAAVSVVTQDEIQLGRQRLGLDEALVSLAYDAETSGGRRGRSTGRPGIFFQQADAARAQ